METTTKNSSITSSKRPRPKKRERLTTTPFSATEKVQAVLAVWTERCRPTEVCQQLQINFTTFQHWQRRAMEGMLQALESRFNLAKGEALSPRLQALLTNRLQRMNTRRLSQRLEQIQLARKESSEAKAS